MRPAEYLAQTSFDPVARDGIAHAARNRQSQPRRAIQSAVQGIDNNKTAGTFASAVVDFLKFRPLRQPHPAGESFAPRSQFTHPETVKRWRPFARRRARTLRPLADAMRVRKPCLFTRRRRLG